MGDIDFSDKYEPLFELLTARQDLADLRMLVNNMKGKPTKPMLDKLERLVQLAAVDTVLISGGRDSGKTFGFGVFCGVASYVYGHRILYTRQTMSSTDNSITKALDNRLELLKIDSFFTYANHNYTVKRGKGVISITGQRTSSGTQTAKLKSIEDYSVFATEEGEELTDYEAWQKIKRSIRATDVQCVSVIVFNPPTKNHFLYKEFYQNVPAGFNGIKDRVMYIHTTYLDNGKENMAEHNWNEYEELRLLYEQYEAMDDNQRKTCDKKIFKGWRTYRTSILGGFRDVAEGVIFDYTIGKFPALADCEYKPIYGADQGFTHPTAVIKIYVDKKRKKVYLKQVFYKTGCSESQVYEAIKTEVGSSKIWCDDAAAMFIKGLKDRGLNIEGAKKPKIKDRILLALDYEIIIDPDSEDLLDEMDLYRWAKTKSGDKLEKEEPVDEDNHAIDAWMYAFYRWLNAKIGRPGEYS